MHEQHLSKPDDQNESSSVLHQMERRLEEATQTLNSLTESAQRKFEASSTGVESNLKSVLHKAQERRDKLSERIRTYREASSNASEDLRLGVEMAWEDFKDAVRSASDRF